MSVVTNVILAADADETAAIESINSKFIRDRERPFVLLNCDNAPTAGHKAVERTVCLGAFNYLDLKLLVDEVIGGCYGIRSLEKSRRSAAIGQRTAR